MTRTIVLQESDSEESDTTEDFTYDFRGKYGIDFRRWKHLAKRVRENDITKYVLGKIEVEIVDGKYIVYETN